MFLMLFGPGNLHLVISVKSRWEAIGWALCMCVKLLLVKFLAIWALTVEHFAPDDI